MMHAREPEPLRQVQFCVYGVAQPKGSTRAFVVAGKPVITSSNRNLKDWEHAIAASAQPHAGELLLGPVRVGLRFVLPRPRSLPKREHFHLTRPDLDKLSRGAIDALTGVLFKDDSQVVELHCAKFYAGTNEAPHVQVTLESGPEGAPR
jgi:crossover junction endodeoxyribonuclease RusA